MTTSEIVENKIAIPSFLESVNERLPSTQKLLPAKLRQKIYIIEDQLAVALAGSEYEMIFFVEELKNNFKYRELTLSNLDTFLADFDYEEVQDSAALMLFAETTELGTAMHYRHFGKWRESLAGLYEQVFACGSGSEYFIREAKAEMAFGGSGNMNLLNRAISLNFILLAKLLVQERVTLETIKKYWGAGFEIIYYDGNKFSKMDDITYVIWTGNLDLQTGEHQEKPIVILNFKYYGEILVINATNGEKVEGYGVPPIHLKKDQIQTEQLPTAAHFNGKRMCSIYILELSNGKVITPAFFTEKAEYTPDLTNSFFDEEGTDVVLRDGIHFDTNPITVDFDKDGYLYMLVDQEVVNTLMESVMHTLSPEF